jgi:hypothetical protein
VRHAEQLAEQQTPSCAELSIAGVSVHAGRSSSRVCDVRTCRTGGTVDSALVRACRHARTAGTTSDVASAWWRAPSPREGHDPPEVKPSDVAPVPQHRRAGQKLAGAGPMRGQFLTISQVSEGLDHHARGQRVLPLCGNDNVPGRVRVVRHNIHPAKPARILLRVQA